MSSTLKGIEIITSHPFQLIKQQVDTEEDYDNEFKITGVLFYLLLAISLAMFIYAVYLLVKYWKHLKTWLKIVCVILLLSPFPGATILSILLIHMLKDKDPIH